MNLLVSANGNVLRSEIVGAIKMKVFLSGMPELRLGLNDKVRPVQNRTINGCQGINKLYLNRGFLLLPFEGIILNDMEGHGCGFLFLFGPS